MTQESTIKFFDMFSGTGGFRAVLEIKDATKSGYKEASPRLRLIVCSRWIPIPRLTNRPGTPLP